MQTLPLLTHYAIRTSRVIWINVIRWSKCTYDALATVRQTGNLPVPLHIRNAPTKLMKDLGYHDGYKYPHDYPGHFTEQQYLPDELKDARFWHAQHSPSEERLYNWMVTCWGERFKN